MIITDEIYNATRGSKHRARARMVDQTPIIYDDAESRRGEPRMSSYSQRTEIINAVDTILKLMKVVEIEPTELVFVVKYRGGEIADRVNL